MRITIAPALLFAATLAAQEPPVPPAPPVAAAPIAPAHGRAVAAPAPVAAPVFVAPSFGAGFGAGFGIAAPVAPAAPVFVEPNVFVSVTPPVIAAPVFAEPFIEFQGRGEMSQAARDAAREAARIASEAAREQARIQSEMMREQSRIQSEQARAQGQRMAEISREQGRIVAEQGRAMADAAREQGRIVAEQGRAMAAEAREQAQAAAAEARAMAADMRINGPIGMTYIAPMAPMGPAFHEMPPRAWAQSDPADSLYRLAQETMTKGDYRKAAQLFKELPTKYKYSAYAVDAMYWSAHAQYRVGTTQDLQEALQTLEKIKTDYPNSRIRGSQADVAALQVRIAGVLSQRGMGGSDIVKRALDQNKSVCDSEEQQIRSAALNALMQTDPAAATDYANKILAKKDDCSREMRRNAIYLVGNKHDAQSTATLIAVAKGDPSSDVRGSAINYLGRSHDDVALAALEDLMKSSDDENVQREAVRALAGNSTARARAAIKALVERNDVKENLRRTALQSLDPEHATQEDVAWLQTLYAKTESRNIQASIINAMGRLGGQQNEKWFISLVNNENESIDVRLSAIREAGKSMSIADLGKLYDQTGQRNLRQEIVRQLGQRREPESIDKLGEIIKGGTDVAVRQSAINALSNKKDDRATKLLLQLIDRP